MYRARTFLGPLEAVAPIPTNVIMVSFGRDALLVIQLGNERRAYDMERRTRVPL